MGMAEGWAKSREMTGKGGLAQSRFHLVLFIPFIQREAKKGLEPAAAQWAKQAGGTSGIARSAKRDYASSPGSQP